jgi:small subunit ribosomal protein S5
MYNQGPRQYNRGPQEPSEFFEKVVQVNRVSKKTKGGDKRSLSVIVVVGDRKGRVGVGLGKAGDAQSAVRKATTYAKKHFITIELKDGRTIAHDVFVKLGAAKVILKTAPEGRGVIAGGPVRVVVEAAGIKDIVSKTLGTKNKASNVYAALEALRQLKPLSVVSAQLSDNGQPVVDKSVTEKQKTGKPEAENRKPKTDNRKTEPKKGEKK